jgi:hypothetical protein
MCLLGATNQDIADNLDVALSSVGKWISEIPEFSDAVKGGREVADEKVAQSLYNTALDGNTTAQIFWLKNRRSKEWRDKQEINLQSEDGSMSPTDEARNLARSKIAEDFSE